MKLSKITLRAFKEINEISLELGNINFLIGANNSGKSSVLQGIHSAVTAAQSQIEAGGSTVIAEQELRYSPTADFSKLGYFAPSKIDRMDAERE